MIQAELETAGRPLASRLARRFRRITTAGDYLPEIDGVRFIAIGMVLLQHMYERVSRRSQSFFPQAAESPGWVFSQGDFGVQLFFALSGFILFRGLCRMADNERSASQNYGRYLLRRVTRLEPPYLLILTGIFLFLVVTGYQSGFSKSAQEGQQTLGQSFIASLGYSHVLFFGAFPKLNPPCWSLETEFQFYLLAPLIVWPLRKSLGSRTARCLVLCLLVMALLRLAVPFAYDIKYFRYSIGVYLPLFLVGFLAGELAELISSKATPGPVPGWVWDAIWIGSFAIMLRTPYPGDGFASGLVYCLLLLGLLVGCTCGAWLRRLLSWSLIPAIGGMCYSLYLVHLPLMEVVGNVTRNFGRGFSFPVYVGIQGALLLASTLAVGGIFFLLVEQPCMNRDWPGRLWRYVARRKSADSP